MEALTRDAGSSKVFSLSKQHRHIAKLCLHSCKPGGRFLGDCYDYHIGSCPVGGGILVGRVIHKHGGECLEELVVKGVPTRATPESLAKGRQLWGRSLRGDAVGDPP